MKSEIKQKEMRHEPIQARSSQRVEHILDVASKLISEVGYDRATTNDIAKRANVPIGSLYQYFPNKHALLHALSTRYLTQLREYFLENRPNTDTLSVAEFLSSVIDILVEFRKTHKSFKQMFLSVHMNSEISITAKEMDDEFIQLISDRLAAEYRSLSIEQRERISYVLLGMIRSLFTYLSIVDNALWQEMKEETKQAMEAYLKTFS